MSSAAPSGQTRMQDIWSRRGVRARLLWPVSLVYRALIALRRLFYRIGVLRSMRVSVPIVVVGNVVVGGAGKTPVVIALVEHLRSRGWTPGVVSGGYGRSSTGTQFFRGGDSDASFTQDCAQAAAKIVGDEPALIALRCKVPVVVAQKRSDAAQALLAEYPDTDVIVCDDGLQHLALARDVDICVFGSGGVGNGWLLPAGPLREPWPRRVDFVLHSGVRPAGGRAPSFQLQRRLGNAAVTADGSAIPLAQLAQPPSGEPYAPLLALAGTAQPEDFFAMLRARGIVLDGTLALPDHFDFDSWELNQDKRYKLICTEKDAVKLWRRFPHAMAVPLELSIEQGFLSALDAKLQALRP